MRLEIAALRDFDPAMAHVGQSRRLRSALALWPSPLHPEQDMADVCGTQVSAPRYWSLRDLSGKDVMVRQIEELLLLTCLGGFVAGITYAVTLLH